MVLLKDSTKSPLAFYSMTAFEGLRTKIMEKLNCYSLKLQYCLENDKPKEGSTLIQCEEDFIHFMACMHSLSVPQKTASGKASLRAVKPFHVVFENTNNKPVDPPVNSNSKKSSKQVSNVMDYSIWN